jgi:heterodisulfide reductase subunit B
MKYSIFGGCLVQNRFPEYEKSATKLLDSLELDHTFIDTFSCCGSQIIESINEDLLLLTAGRNLAIASQNNIDVIITLCGSCRYVLRKTLIEVQNKDQQRFLNEKLKKIDLEFKNSIEVRHLAEILNKNSIYNKLSKLITRKIPIKVAFQNPCMLFRPKRISQIDEEENELIKNLLNLTGADILSYDYQDKCCEGTMLAFKKKIGIPLVENRYDELKEIKPDLFVVACPNCQIVYNEYPQISGTSSIPSVFFTQILGLSLGFSFETVGLNENSNAEVIKQILIDKGIDLE